MPIFSRGAENTVITSFGRWSRGVGKSGVEGCCANGKGRGRGLWICVCYKGFTRVLQVCYVCVEVVVGRKPNIRAERDWREQRAESRESERALN
jgi:hypothetical protein